MYSLEILPQKTSTTLDSETKSKNFQLYLPTILWQFQSTNHAPFAINHSPKTTSSNVNQQQTFSTKTQTLGTQSKQQQSCGGPFGLPLITSVTQLSHSHQQNTQPNQPTLLINGNLPVILKYQINILQTTLTNIKFTDKKWNSRFSPFDLIMNNRKFKQVFKYKLELEQNRFNQVMEKQENELDEENELNERNEENEEIMELGTPETQSFMDSGTPETRLDIDLVNNIIV